MAALSVTKKMDTPTLISPIPTPLLIPVDQLTPNTYQVIQRQATINIGTIGHVAHGKSTVVKAISGVQTVRFKNELERNITIKLGYANAKVCVPLSFHPYKKLHFSYLSSWTQEQNSTLMCWIRMRGRET